MADIMGGMYAPVGVCKTFGTNNAALIAGLFVGVSAGYVAYLAAQQKEEENPTGLDTTRVGIIVGAVAGTLAAIPAYFTCKGVEAGVPVKKR